MTGNEYAPNICMTPIASSRSYKFGHMTLKLYFKFSKNDLVIANDVYLLLQLKYASPFTSASAIFLSVDLLAECLFEIVVRRVNERRID